MRIWQFQLRRLKSSDTIRITGDKVQILKRDDKVTILIEDDKASLLTDHWPLSKKLKDAFDITVKVPEKWNQLE